MKTLPLGEISAETFLADYWQKKPLLIRQAFPNLNPFIAADELAGLACEEGVESRLITQSASNWDIQHGPFNDDVFAQLPPTDWTLLVQSVDHWVPQAAAFLRQFNFIPNWRIDDLMISYANDGGGVGPHYDNYDVFLVQAEGQRRWEVGGLFNENSPRRPDVPVMLLEQWQAEETWLLEAGDMLYVPPQVGHNGTAVGDGCMTYSVGFRAPSHAEIITSFSDAISDQLRGEQRYSDSNLALQKNSGEISAQALEQVKSIIQQCYEQPALLQEWFGKHVTEIQHASDDTPRGLQCLSADLIKHQKEGGVLVRNENSRFAYIEQDELVLLFVDGENFECSEKLAVLARQLCEEITINLAEQTFDNNELDLLSELVQQGSLYPDFPN